MQPKLKGITIIEVLVIVVVVFTLLALLLPALPRGNRKPMRSQCMSMIKQVGLGYILWVTDNEKQNLPFRIDYKDGGLMNPPDKIDLRINGLAPQPASLRSNAWVQFAFINKELQDPKVLLCPADRKKNRQAAKSWDMSPEGGFCNPAYQNNAVSYCINLDAGFSPDGGPLDLAKSQTQVLLSERHMEYDTVNSACSANVGLTRAIKVARQSATNALVNVGWKEENPKIHLKGGNVALLDGSAHQVNEKQLQELLGQKDDDKGELHFIYP